MATPYDEWARQNFGQWYREHFIPGMNPIATSEEDYLAKRNWGAAQAEFGHRYPNQMNFPSTSRVGGDKVYQGFRHPNRPGLGALGADSILGEEYLDQRQVTRGYKGKMGMLAKGWNPETIKKAYGAPERPPWPVGGGGVLKARADPFAHSMLGMPYGVRSPAYPRMSSVNQLSDAAAKKLGMVTEWKKMLNMPKWELAHQLTSFVSKWGKPALKLIAKLPK